MTALAHSPRLSSTLIKLTAAAFILLLPLVSFPWFPPGLRAIISPASLYFLAPLLVVSFVSATVRGRWQQRHLTWGIWILCTVLLSGLPLFLYEYEASQEQLIFRFTRAALSIAFAVGFYLAGHYIATSLRQSAHFIVRLLNVGLVAALALGFLGALTIIRVPIITDVYIFMREFTTVSGRNVIGGLNRLAALTFEPSFAGLEYTVWWLPFSIAAFVTLRKRRYLFASILLVAFTLLTRSLTGLMGLMGLGLVLVWLWRFRRSIRSLITLAALSTVLAAPLAPILGFDQGVAVLQRLSQEWERFEQGDLQRSGPSDGSLAVRSALSHTALNVWRASPLFGGGLGVAGYLFVNYVPAWVHANPYMEEFWRYVLAPDATRVFPSAKNIYFRTLSEMGLVGFIVFSGLCLTVVLRQFRGWQNLRHMTHQQDYSSAVSLVLLASVLASGAMAFCYLSVDSFAFPFLWVWWGLGMGFIQKLRR